MGPQPYNAVLQVLVKDVDRHDKHITQLQTEVVSIRVVIAALAAKVAVYAALGATIGGAVVGAIATLVLN